VIASIGQLLVNDRALLTSMLRFAYSSMTDDLAGRVWDLALDAGIKAVSKGVPVVGWIIGAGDLAAQAFATGQQAAGFVDGLVTLPAVSEVAPLWWDVLASDPARLAAYQDAMLRGWDVANAALPNPGSGVNAINPEPRDGLAALVLRDGRGTAVGMPETQAEVTGTLVHAMWPTPTARAGWLVVKADWGVTGPELCRYPVTVRWLTPQVGTPWCDSTQVRPSDAGYMFQYQWALSADGSELLERLAPDDWDLAGRDKGWEPGGEMNWVEEAFGYREQSLTVEGGRTLATERPATTGATWQAPEAVRVRSSDLGITSITPPPCEDDAETGAVCDI
jgi:hypothetical protein